MKKLAVILVVFQLVYGLPLQAGKKDSGKAGAALTVLSGKVTDKLSGEELAGVLIRVQGTNLKTYSGFEGEFRFEGLKPGTYQVVTTYPSYKKTFVFQAEVKAGGDSNLSIELKPE